ncbi:uncharacterized protein UV8b_05536 [Ustilaginoidea virens]|uniref:Uncharacterized protein n=1 Tax=Ustilaginoidea virens TaxID=1159556 RepID=A0A8E5HU00_USTVR|nr:uncharacterized protein UV8b_05536 [Ustilaginoidea virens]QUC21293.1 hypothetical protein UV8b_05536 [Ustilaginoidea virens]
MHHARLLTCKYSVQCDGFPALSVQPALFRRQNLPENANGVLECGNLHLARNRGTMAPRTNPEAKFVVSYAVSKTCDKQSRPDEGLESRLRSISAGELWTASLHQHEDRLDARPTEAAGPAVQVGSAAEQFDEFRKQNKRDPYLDAGKLYAVDGALESGNVEKQAAFGKVAYAGELALLLLAVGSPPVPLTDDEHLPVDALRAWVIGAVLSWAALPPGSCPPGDWGTLDGPCRSNPGPFNVKEHANVTMMTAAGSTVNYAVDILLA